jgi:hypothetical protein
MSLLSIVPTVAFAQVFKCKDATGKIAYQNTGCATDQQQSKPVIVTQPEPPPQEKAASATARTGNGSGSTANAQSSPSSDPAPNYASSVECERAKHEEDIARNRITKKAGDIAAARGRAEQACLGPQGYANAEAARAEGKERARLRQAATPPAPTAPTAITSCDPGGCFDNLGNHYIDAGGGVLHGSNGKVCIRTGTTVNCN